MSSSVLYDLPGPRGRRRNLIIGVLATAGIVALIAWVIYRFNATGQFEYRRWAQFEYQAVQTELVSGLLATLKAAGIAAVLALLFGAIFAAGRLSDHRILRAPSSVVVELFRAIPLLILIFFGYYVPLQYGWSISNMWALVVGLTLYNGSVLAEIFRAGVNAVPRGQSEAASAIGLRKGQTLRIILLPQAVRSMLPAIVSQLVVLLKDTALGFLVTYQELLYYARYIGSQGQFGRPIVPSTIVVAAIYIALCLLLTALATYLERRNRRSKKGGAAPTPTAEQAVEAGVL
jgi:glutamate transport system permease protein